MRKARKPEMMLQIMFVQYLNKLDIIYCASAGGMRTDPRTARQMKASGYKRGFPDVFIYEPRHGYHGLSIELKSKTGLASDYQKEWCNALVEHGYKAIIMPSGLEIDKGLAWLKKEVRQYLGVKNV